MLTESLDAQRMGAIKEEYTSLAHRAAAFLEHIEQRITPDYGRLSVETTNNLKALFRHVTADCPCEAD